MLTEYFSLIKCQENKLQDKVLFAGRCSVENKTNVDELYSMDVELEGREHLALVLECRQ